MPSQSFCFFYISSLEDGTNYNSHSSYTLCRNIFFWAQPRTTTKHNQTSPSTWCKISRNCRREISHLEHAEKKLETTAGAPGFHIIFVVLMVKKAGFQQRKDMKKYQHLLQKISLMSFDFTTLAKNQVLSPPKPHPWRIFGDQWFLVDNASTRIFIGHTYYTNDVSMRYSLPLWPVTLVIHSLNWSH